MVICFLTLRSSVWIDSMVYIVLQEIDQPALIPHIAEASSLKYPYEVLFRSLHKLLMDTATSEYPLLLALLLTIIFFFYLGLSSKVQVIYVFNILLFFPFHNIQVYFL